MSVGSLTRELRPSLPRVDTRRSRELVTSSAVITVGALIVLAAVLRFYRIGHQGFWFDEANASADLHYSIGKMLGMLPQNQTTPPLYYLIGWVWARVFGFSEVPLRSLSALAGVLVVPVVYVAGAKLVSRRAGLIAAALAACNPFLIWYSQEARPYMLLVLLSAASLVAFAYAREDRSPRLMTIWAVVSMLALADHYYALLVVVPEALWLFAIDRRRRSVQLAVVVVGLCGLGLLPLAIAQNHTGNASWIAPIPLLPRLGAIIPQFLVGFQGPAHQVQLRVAELLVLISFVLLALCSDPDERRGALTMGGFAVGGLVLNLLLIAVGIDDLITRNILALWVPAALVVAGGFGARRAGLFGVTAAAALCAIGIWSAIGVAQNRIYQRPDWRGPARVLGARPAPGVTRAILVQHYRYLLPMSMYVDGLKPWPHRGRRPYGPIRVSEIDVIAISAPRVPLCWWGAACNLTGSAMQASYPIPGFRELWVRKAYQFTVMRLVSDGGAPRALTPAMVSGALTATTLPRDELLYQQ